MPRFERRDEYEKIAEFQDRAKTEKANWSLGNLNSNQLMVFESQATLPSYDAENETLELFNYKVPVRAEISPSVRSSQTNNVDFDKGSMSLQEDSLSTDYAYFTNIGRATDTKIDGRCFPDYREQSNFSRIALKVAPQAARKLKNTLKIYYVVSFDIPSYATGEWCFSGGEDNGGTNIVTTGGINRNIVKSNYLHMRLHRMIVSDGSTVFLDRSF